MGISKKPVVLITGAAGFLGMHVAERLIDDGNSVIGIDNLNDYYDVNLKQARLARLSARNGFQFVETDLRDHDGVSRLLGEHAVSQVVHLAAQAGVRYSIENPRAYADSNLDGFLSVLEACRQNPVEHMVYASSSSVYGQNAKTPFHEDDPVLTPVSLYAATKRSNELMAQAYSHLYDIPLSGMRFFTVYGPYGRPDMAYFSFTKSLLEGRPIKVFNHGKMQRDFTYIDDAVDGVVGLLNAPPPVTAGARHEIYNIGNNRPVTLDRFIKAIEAATGVKAERVDMSMQPGDVPMTYADIDKLAGQTGYAPDVTIEAGIARFVAWYRSYYSC